MATLEQTFLGAAPDRRAAPRLIETDAFPFEFLSQLAERESWRKEVFRPIYHLHKWWAKRLGSVFRGMILGCVLPADADLADAFYRRHSLTNITVFDPFMGSGTTIGEAHKLGCTALGRDINPVAAEAVRVALGPLDRRSIQETFLDLEKTVGRRIRTLYRTLDACPHPCEVLYYFWVKQVACPQCDRVIDLFNSRIFARNACPERKPEVRGCCPQCGGIVAGTIHDRVLQCPGCGDRFDPHHGAARGKSAFCAHCRRDFDILPAVRRGAGPPRHRLFAKLVLTSSGDKHYLAATEEDQTAYEQCSAELSRQLHAGTVRLPTLELADGYNTRQAINYGYRRWRDFFNDRQLLALGWLQEAIAAIADPPTRDALLCLFSSVLEFNNMFASYKGEGTGAVRHMFSHHILKPERMPIEANVWGTPKSSGSFSGLYRTRLRRLLDYRAAPTEIGRPRTAAKTPRADVVQCSGPFSGGVSVAWPPEALPGQETITLSCGSSDATHLPDKSVDLVVTDPPFFDNVHYSELADFFFAWQSLFPRGFMNGAATTRNDREVQDTSPAEFARKLQAVFAEACRVLNDDGLLVFTYHHSRAEGWQALAEAVCDAGLCFVNAHPVKAEMSVAAPKSQAKDPIQIDVIVVCRKRPAGSCTAGEPQPLERADRKAQSKAARLGNAGIKLSRNDCRVIVFSQFLVEAGQGVSGAEAARLLSENETALDQFARELARRAAHHAGASGTRKPLQMSLFT